MQDLKVLAREHRKHPTLAEGLVWAMVRKKKLGVRFQRQKPMSGFILDFYCPAARLAVELDGPLHRRAYDARRDRVLAGYGILTLRFKNQELFGNVLGVRQKIMETAHLRCNRAK